MSQITHESSIKTPRQLITVVALAFVVPIVIIVLLSQFIANTRRVDKDSPAMTHEAVARRLRPVGDVVFADAGGGESIHVQRGGEEIYKSVCSACHAGGAAGAPKFGDQSDWAQRLSKGQRTLVETAIRGVGKMMPARGGNAELNDLEVERAVVFMANSAGGKFREPGEPAAAPQQKAAAPVAAKADGKKIYEAGCVACHGAGLAGAPKAGDKAAWAPRLKTGMDAIYASALKGNGAMPAKGGNAALADTEVKAAVDYLAGLAK
jgi:cytochrome c5